MKGESAHELSPRTVLLAVAEVGAAIVAARLVTNAVNNAGSERSDHHGMTMPTAMPMEPPSVHWQIWEYGVLGAAAVGIGMFALRRSAASALAAAVGLVALATSPVIRQLAASSHLVMMAVLEVLLVAAPLLVVSALPRRVRQTRSSVGYSVVTVVFALAYAGVLIAFHLPSLHQSASIAAAGQGWDSLIVVAVGVVYWFSIWRAPQRVPLRLRRAALIGGQEVAAFIGLLSVLGAFPTMSDHGFAGLPAAWDQRLGGLLMLMTCAVVSVPALRRLTTRNAPDSVEMRRTSRDDAANIT